MTSDISRMIVAGQKEIFMENFNAFPIEYTNFVTKKSSNKKSETYDSMSNLKAAGEKVEGDAITYGSVEQAYQTTITNKTYANGYAVTLEAVKFDLYGTINSVKAKELARTMRELEETNNIAAFDNAFATNLADGVPLCSNSKPCKGAPGVLNDTLATASAITNPTNHKDMIKLFAAFKNHAGGRIKSFPDKLLTNVQNMMDIEEIYQSANKANEISNTKNSLPKLRAVYSTYLTSLTAYFMIDSSFEHAIHQVFMDTEFDQDEDKINTKNLYLNAIAIYGNGVLPNIGIVGNAGV